MRIHFKNIETYEFEEGFMVDVEEGEKLYKEAWIYNKDYGIKSLMFGGHEDIERFRIIVKENVEEYIDEYKKLYMGG